MEKLIGRRGRPKGQPIKRTVYINRLTEEAIYSGITPLEYFLRILRAPEPVRRRGEDELAFVARAQYDTENKIEVAKAAAPFIHPKVAQRLEIDHNNKNEDKEINILELAKNVAFLLTMAADAKTSPPAKQLN